MKPVIRPFTADDYGSVAAVVNSVYVDYPTTPEEVRFNDEHWDPKCLHRRWVADVDGSIVGLAEVSQNPGMYHPRRFSLEIVVLPAFQGKRIGAALYDRVLAELDPLEPLSVRVGNIRADMIRGIKFLQDRGFVETMRTWESRLDVRSFDPSPYAGAVEAVLAQGIAIESVGSLAVDPERNRKLYDLDRALAVDVPSPEPITPVTYEFFVSRVFDDPNLIPEAYVIAMDNGHYVGQSNLWRSMGSDDLNIGLTGVRREYRRRGIALALKLRAMSWALENGYGVLKTWNASNNRAMLSINERLGFVKQPAWVSWLKILQAEDP